MPDLFGEVPLWFASPNFKQTIFFAGWATLVQGQSRWLVDSAMLERWHAIASVSCSNDQQWAKQQQGDNSAALAFSMQDTHPKGGNRHTRGEGGAYIILHQFLEVFGSNFRKWSKWP